MDIAEVVNLEKKDLKYYEESLKNYRDLKNALDSSEEKGKQIGIIENKRLNSINLYKAGVALETISEAIGIEIEELKTLLKDAGLAM